MRYLLAIKKLLDDNLEPEVDVPYLKAEAEGSLLKLETSITREIHIVRAHREFEAYAFSRMERFVRLDSERTGTFVFFHQR